VIVTVSVAPGAMDRDVAAIEKKLPVCVRVMIAAAPPALVKLTRSIEPATPGEASNPAGKALTITAGVAMTVTVT